MTVLGSLGTQPGCKAIPVGEAAMAVMVWVNLIMALLRPWSEESRAVWGELSGYRTNKAYLCKNNSSNEHEYVVVDMSRSKDRLYLRIERSVGERTDSPTSSSSSIGSGSSVSSPSPSPSADFYERRSSGSSISIASVRDSITKVSDSMRRMVRRLSDSSLSRPSGMSSNRYSAADTIQRLPSLPAMTNIVRTIEFNSADRSKRPCLWDLMILACVIHEDSVTYTLLGRQCFWFADTMFAMLEKWAETGKDVSITNGKPKSSILKRNKSSGTVGLLVVHKRDNVAVERIWGRFGKKREELDKERQEYEDTKTEEMRKAEESTRQLAEIKKQDKQKERQLQQQIMLIAEMKEQQEKERQEFQRQLQQLQQKDHENTRRLQAIEQMIITFNTSQTPSPRVTPGPS